MLHITMILEDTLMLATNREADNFWHIEVADQFKGTVSRGTFSNEQFAALVFCMVHADSKLPLEVAREAGIPLSEAARHQREEIEKLIKGWTARPIA